MTAYKKEDSRNCFVMEGKMALPNQYFAGRLGSKFLISLRDKKKILGVRCPECNKVFIPPRQYCQTCWSTMENQWVELSGEGQLVNFTIVRYSDKHLPRRAPYILGEVLLDGADTPLVHIVAGIDFKEVKAGQRVKAVFAEKTTDTLLDIDHFEPL